MSLVIFSYLFIFRERECGGEREGKRHGCARETSTDHPSQGPGLQPRHTDLELDGRLFGLLVCTQTTEPHQPGFIGVFKCPFKSSYSFKAILEHYKVLETSGIILSKFIRSFLNLSSHF